MIEMPIGWLSPTGEMIKCNTYEHITVAFRLVDKYVFNYTGFNPDEVLIENQWIHITRGQSSIMIIMFIIMYLKDQL